MTEDTNTYRHILRSSSIMAGAQALIYLIGLVRIKIVAVLLGPGGVGLVTLFSAALQLVGTVSSLGIGGSAVRDVVEAYAQHDETRAARTVRILRRVCWATGLLGWFLAIVLSEPIGKWLVNSPEQARTIAILGVTLLVSSVTGGQLALLQGLRRIGDLARANVFGVGASSFVAVAFYAWLGLKGIVPVLLATPLISLACTYWFARRVPVAPVALSWTDTWQGARRMVVLGAAMMSSGLLTAGIDMLTRSLISHKLGMEAVGIYQSAWAISGMFAGFVLSAMGTDFYPRLTAAIDDQPRSVRAVNEQLEIGILLALPGLLGTLVFAPWIMEVLYSKNFLAGADLLPWMLLGVFGRVLSWPMAFIQLAKGASRSFFATEMIFGGLYAALTVWLVSAYGMMGAAYAFAAVYVFYTGAMLWVAFRLIRFVPSTSVKRLFASAFVCVAAGLSIHPILRDGLYAKMAGVLIIAVSALISLRGLASRIGSDHRLVKWVCLIPGGRQLLMFRAGWVVN